MCVVGDAHVTCMEAEINFLIPELTGSARRHIPLFQMHQFLDPFAMGLTVAVSQQVTGETSDKLAKDWAKVDISGSKLSPR